MKLYLFCCATSIDTDELMRACRFDNGDTVKAISLPCSGKIDVLYLAKAFETGADGVAVITCKQGECRYLEGNLRARNRAEAVDSLLDEIGIGRGRVEVISMTDGGTERVVRDVHAFLDRIASIGSVGRRDEPSPVVDSENADKRETQPSGESA